MSYNPGVHAVGPHPSRKQQRRYVDPRVVGTRHSELVGVHGPVGVSQVDLRNKVSTSSGWRVPYFSGEDFEVFYELICTRNATGKLCHKTLDRCVRVLSGQLFITHEGEVTTVLMNQVCTFTRGSEYELASPGDSDVELLIIQGKDYDTDLIHITEPGAINDRAAAPFHESSTTLSRVTTEKAEQAATRLLEERAAKERNRNKRSPVPKRANEVAMPGSSPQAQSMPGGRAPLAGQQVVGVNPRPLGAHGFGDE